MREKMITTDTRPTTGPQAFRALLRLSPEEKATRYSVTASLLHIVGVDTLKELRNLVREKSELDAMLDPKAISSR